MNNKKRGFTLIELIAVIAIMSIVLTTILSVLDSGNALYNNGMKSENIETNGRQCISALSQKVKTSREYYDTSEMIDLRFQNISYQGSNILPENMIAYVEDYNNNRYMYMKTLSNGRIQLHQLKFPSQERYKYHFKDITSPQTITPADKLKYDKNAQEKVPYVDGNMDLQEFKNMYPLYSAKYFLYENYGEQYYLWATNDTNNTDNIKFNLEKDQNNDFTIDSDSILGDYIDSLSITKEDRPDGRTSKIYIKVKDKDKTKEITTNIFLLNGNNSAQ